MNKLIFVSLVVLLVFLAGCEPLPPGDLSYIGQSAGATMLAVTQDARRTVVAEVEKQARATQSSLSTQQYSQAEVDRIRMSITGTYSAVVAQSTLAEVTAIANVRSTAQAWEATQFPVTQTAIAFDQEDAIARRNRERTNERIKQVWLYYVFPSAGLAILLYLSWILGMGLALRLKLRQSPGRDPVADPEVLPYLADQIELVQASIRANGIYSNRILSWRNMPGWSSSKWQAVKQGMVEAGLVESTNQGTVVNGGGNLRGLLEHLTDGALE